MGAYFDESLWEDEEEDKMIVEEAERVQHQMQLGGNPLAPEPGRLRFEPYPLFERRSRRFGVHERVIRLRPIQTGNLIPHDRLLDALVRGLRGAVEGVLKQHGGLTRTGFAYPCPRTTSVLPPTPSL